MRRRRVGRCSSRRGVADDPAYRAFGGLPSCSPYWLRAFWGPAAREARADRQHCRHPTDAGRCRRPILSVPPWAAPSAARTSMRAKANNNPRWILPRPRDNGAPPLSAGFLKSGTYRDCRSDASADTQVGIGHSRRCDRHQPRMRHPRVGGRTGSRRRRGVEIVVIGRRNTAAAARASDGHEDRRNAFHDRSDNGKSKSPMGICFVVPLLSLPAGRSPLNLENARRTRYLVG